MESAYDTTSLDLNALDWHAARALLEWQIELGATEAIHDDPVDRFAIAKREAEAAKTNPEGGQNAQTTGRRSQSGAGDTPRRSPPSAPPVEPKIDAIALARTAAAGAADLDQLRQAMMDFDHCGFKRGARSLVFGDGNPAARLLILTEAPNRDEDREGRPFVGPAGQLLDRMLAAIDMDRMADTLDRAVYITNVLPWRPPHTLDPTADECAMMLPFVQRHIELIDPEVIILMGNLSCYAALSKSGIRRLRGTWATAFGRPAMPMTHPGDLLRSPQDKRAAWSDLLAVKSRLRGV